MLGWFRTHTEALQAVSAVATVLVALVALVGVKVQLDEADRVQALQSARGAYLAQQALAVQNPKLAQPADACALMASADGVAYESYVTHLLFTAEQMLDVSEGWEPTFLYEFQPHSAYLCAYSRDLNASAALHNLMERFTADTCAAAPRCPGDTGP